MGITGASHGGKDPGTINGNTYESKINLEISQKIELELAKLGASTILTRNGDYDLATPNARWRKKSDFDNRIKLINNSNANLYLSIHLNYLENSSYSGPQVFYNNEENQKIAKLIQEELNKTTNHNREIKKIPTKTYMYSKLEVPGVLIECGFLSNYEEKERLKKQEYQENLAKVVAKSITKYYN